MNAVALLRRHAGLTQSELATRAGTSQPTIAAYERGTKSPTLRTLERLAAAAGLDLAINFVPPMTREDRRSLALHEAVASRLLLDPEGVVSLGRRNLTKMAARVPTAAPLVEEWGRVLERPPTAIVEVLRDPGLHARELRHVSPFAGVLSVSARLAAYREFQAAEERGLAG